VRDVGAARRFWVEVMGFEPINEQPTYCLVFNRGAGLAIILTDHGDTVSVAFDKHHAGLDHLSYAVPDGESLRRWEQRLADFQVPHSPIVEADAGHHLDLRAPDNVPIELYVMTPEFARELGLDAGREPVAATG
jgi:catechol 2,3-dioxygenase-like lactoylglutathione lyase family enzyme